MLLDFLIAPAHAQQAAAKAPSLFDAFWPLLVMVPLLYLVMIRPQMKRQKEQKLMLDQLAKGDELVLAGGLAGRITAIGEVYLSVEIAEGVTVKVEKSAINKVLPKGTLKTL